MNKFIAIIAGEPNSINSEIIVKAWKKIKNKKNLFIIGNFSLITKQIEDIGLKIPVKKINKIGEVDSLNKLCILDVDLKFKSSFNVNIKATKKYVFKCFDIAHNLAVRKKIIAFINTSVDKKIFDGKYLGVTEYLASKNNIKDKEVMMIYNKKLSVVPLTTHLDIKDVTKKIKKDLIIKKILTLNNSYRKLFKQKPRLAVLGLNPHNSENRSNSIEKKIIFPAIQELKRLHLDVSGPYPADTIFGNRKKLNYNILIGMYHDQVLAPFKALFGYDAINITLGLKYLRISPDHGVARDIIGFNKANPQSLISAITFVNKIND